MAFNLYKEIMKDKGSDKKETDNQPLQDYLFTEEDQSDEKQYGFYSTSVIALNLAFAGRVDGAIPIGKMSMISAPPQLGKSIIAMAIIQDAQKTNPDCTTILIDAEYSFDFEVAKKIGIDTSKEKLLIYQENSIERVKNIILKNMALVPKEERKNILIILDSLGTLVSSKSVDDGLAGKDVKDMTLTQKKNDLANILLNTKSTVFTINHVYNNIGGFGDPLSIPGGLRFIFNSSCIVMGTSRAKETEKEDGKKVLNGYIITTNTFKSRFSKANTVLQFRIKTNGGLDPFYGILPDAIEGGYVRKAQVLDDKETKKQGKEVYKEKAGYYQRSHIPNDEPIKEDDLYTAKFWLPVFTDTNFKQYLEDKYQFRGDFEIARDREELEKII